MIDVLYPAADGLAEVRNTNETSWEPKKYASTPALINVTMETYLAYRYSNWSLDNCLSCHYDAEPRVPAGVYGAHVAAPQVFSFLYRRAPSRR
mgnify:FL=1